MPSGVLAFDLSPELCGWGFAGRDARLEAGGFVLLGVVPDLGAQAAALDAVAEQLITRFDPELLAYEAPLLLRKDTLLKLRHIYGLGMVLERLANAHGLPVQEMDPKRIKAFMTGDPYAKKPRVVASALSLGVALPATDAAGRKDAADGLGAALVALSILDPVAISPWLAKLRGSLL